MPTNRRIKSSESVLLEDNPQWYKDAVLYEVHVRAFCDGRLSHYKIPRYVVIVDEFPMTVTGKVRKVQMREETTERLGLG